MPVEIRDLDGGIGNLIYATGVVTEEEYVDALNKHLTQNKDKFIRYKYSLSIFAEVANLILSAKTITMIASLSKSAAKINPDAIVAVVANQDSIYYLARMYQLLDETGWEHKVFRNRDDAVAWIKERTFIKHGISVTTTGGS